MLAAHGCSESSQQMTATVRRPAVGKWKRRRQSVQYRQYDRERTRSYFQRMLATNSAPDSRPDSRTRVAQVIKLERVAEDQYFM